MIICNKCKKPAERLWIKISANAQATQEFQIDICPEHLAKLEEILEEYKE